MTTLTSFTSVSLDGYYADARGDMSWAHAAPDDDEWNSFVSGNASGGGALLFGRLTYEMMASFWPTPMAAQQMPVVAERMNSMPKYVASRTLTSAAWSNTSVLPGDLVSAVDALKRKPGPGIAILGSGSVVAQLAGAGLIDTIQIVVVPIILGGGKKLFEGVSASIPLHLRDSRTFRNGNVVLTYSPRA